MNFAKNNFRDWKTIREIREKFLSANISSYTVLVGSNAAGFAC